MKQQGLRHQLEYNLVIVTSENKMTSSCKAEYTPTLVTRHPVLGTRPEYTCTYEPRCTAKSSHRQQCQHSWPSENHTNVPLQWPSLPSRIYAPEFQTVVKRIEICNELGRIANTALTEKTCCRRRRKGRPHGRGVQNAKNLTLCSLERWVMRSQRKAKER